MSADTTRIKAGDRIIARTALDEWRKGFAVTAVEGEFAERDLPGGRRTVRIHDFPVIWIRLSRDGEPTPWPAEDVRLAPVVSP